MIREHRSVKNHRRLAARQGRPGRKEEEIEEVTTTDSEPVAPTTSTRTRDRFTRLFPFPFSRPTPSTTSVVPASSPTPSTTSAVPPVVTPSEPLAPIVPIITTTTSSTVSTSSISSTQSLPPVKTTTSAARGSVTPATQATATHRAIVPTSVPTSSSTAEATTASGGISSGAVAGGVIGGLLGATALAFLALFLVKRYRRKSADALAFNATKFRRSALMLNDPPTLPEKSPLQKQMQQESRPRPPSMIERRMRAPAAPPASASSPYSIYAPHSTDPYGQYAASAAQYNVGMYGADGQVARDPFADMYGSSVGSAAHGQRAAYSQHQNQQQYSPQNYQLPQGSQGSFSPGHIIPSSRTPVPDARLPNPFANPVVAISQTTTSASAVAAARSTASPGSPVPSAHSQSSTSSSSGDSSAPTAPASAPYLRRQATQSNDAPPAYETDVRYADVQRDVKAPQGALGVSINSGTSSSAGSSVIATAGAGTKGRPVSSFTVYNPDDAYGGI